MKNSLLTTAAAVLLALFATSTVFAATGGCTASGLFSTAIDTDWTQSQNVAGETWELPTPLTGNAYQVNCSCQAGDKVNMFYTVASALSQAGKLSGYYKLNDNLDIKTEVDDIPGVTAITPKNSKPIKEMGTYQAGNSKGGVCANDPSDVRAAPVMIGASTRFTLYVSKPFLGELLIPDTHIASVRAGWSNTTTFPSISALEDIAELHVQGQITVPQNCKINQGDVIQVDLGFINANRFTVKGEMPEGYKPVNFDISYDCGDTTTIHNDLEMQINGDDVNGQYTLIGRRRESDNVPDVGIEMLDQNSTKIPFTNGLISISSTGRGSVNLTAWPINLVGGNLSPGKIKGTATITVIVK